MIHILTNTYRTVDPLFGRNARPIELDMGCGKGGFLLTLAETCPDRLILGADIMLGRLRRVARKVERRELSNVELLRADNYELAAFQLPDRSIRRVHLLCPDPWPKARHRHRRLVTTDFLTRLARILEPDGTLHVSTDHAPYQATFERLLTRLPFFAPAPERLAELEHIGTEFERLWKTQGKAVPHLAYRKLL